MTQHHPRLRSALFTLSAVAASAAVVVGGASTNAQGDVDDRRVDPTNAGALDVASFNPPDGFVTTELLSLSSYAGVVVQSNGRIVAGGTAGFAAVPPAQFSTLVGYESDGSVDDSFALRGVARTPVGLTPVPTVLLEDDQGRLLNVGGNAEGEFYVTRHTADGIIDTSFGDFGVALLNAELIEATDAVLQDDGKIVVVGYRPIVVGLQPAELVVGRFTADGEIDTAFGSDGVHRIELLLSATSGGIDLQSDGKIIVGGTAETFDRQDGLASLTRLNTDGSRDFSFGGADGTRLVDVNGLGAAETVQVNTDDTILFGGTGASDQGTFGWLVGKLTADGDLDTTFGTSDGFTVVTEGPASTGDLLRAKVLDDGRLLAVGDSPIQDTINSVSLVGVFTADGELDPTFGDDGIESTLVGTSTSALAAAIQDDGKIVVAGEAANEDGFLGYVARYLGTASTVIPIDEARLAETRVGPQFTTIDGLQEGIGRRTAGQSTEIAVAGRAGIAADALAAIVTLTAIDPAQAGYMTMYDCDDPVPTSSNLNHPAGGVVANSAVVDLGDDGAVCVFTQRATDFVLDATAYVTPDGDLTTFDTTRLLDSRVGAQFTTADGEQQGIGRRSAGQVTQVDVAGRVDIPADAVGAWINVVGLDPSQRGFVTGFECGALRPNASMLNARPGEAVANSTLLPIGDDGQICLYTQHAMDLVVDVMGYVLPGDDVITQYPARLVESRQGAAFRTVDDQQEGIGKRTAGQVTEVTVTGRAGVPDGAVTAVVTVAAVNPDEQGFLSVYTCGDEPPNTSAINYLAGQTTAGQAVVGLSDDGTVCVLSQRPMDLVVDLVGYTV